LALISQLADSYRSLSLRLARSPEDESGSDLSSFLPSLVGRVLQETAASLQKPYPQVVWKLPHVLLGESGKLLLERCLVHLLRNALDHGIESVEERKKVHKSPDGVLQILAEVQEEHLLLVVEDDGRGLPLDILRQRCLEKGLSPETIDFQGAAESIFASRFSTRERVSEISGRGIGLDAVRAELAAAGGKIQLEFREAPSWGWTRCCFVLQIPLSSLNGMPEARLKSY
jgi:signal transduction histidine kinase